MRLDGAGARWGGRVACVVVLAALVAGCGGDDTGAVGSGSPASLEVASGDAVDLLYVQDSLGWGVAERYASGIEDQLGVTVEVTDHAIGELPAVRVAAALEGDAGPWVDAVREAEVIVLFANAIDAGSTDDFEVCLSPSTDERPPPQRYEAADFAPYREVLDEVYDEIWRIRDDRPVVLRAVDFAPGVLAAWREAGIAEECVGAQEAMNRTIREAAEANGATFVSFHDVINGPDHDHDPRGRGWIGDDGVHLSPAGQEQLTEALLASGFTLNTRP